MDCSPEAWASARVADDLPNGSGSPVPLQFMEMACTPPQEMTWQDNTRDAGVVLLMLILIVYVIKFRDRHYD